MLKKTVKTQVDEIELEIERRLSEEEGIELGEGMRRRFSQRLKM